MKDMFVNYDNDIEKKVVHHIYISMIDHIF